MNKINAALMTLVLLVSTAAFGALVPVTEVVEVVASEVGVPAHEAERINVQPCSTCELRTVRLSRDTVYRVGGFDSAAVSFRDYRAAAASAAKAELALVYVKYDVNTNIVLELVVQGSK